MIKDKTYTMAWRATRLTIALGATTSLLAAIALMFGRYLIVAKGLVYNILLAAAPLLFAALLCQRRQRGKHGAFNGVLWVLWVLMFPNAPYMLTDVIHVQRKSYEAGFDVSPSGTAWLGVMFLIAAVLVGCVFGCVFGCLSLYLMHNSVRERRGGAAGWMLCVGMAALSGIGIYIGRFMRFNSWDVLCRPAQLMREAARRITPHTLAFCALFAGMALGIYALFYLCFDVPVKKPEPESIAQDVAESNPNIRAGR